MNAVVHSEKLIPCWHSRTEPLQQKDINSWWWTSKWERILLWFIGLYLLVHFWPHARVWIKEYWPTSPPPSCHSKIINSEKITIKCKALVPICISFLRHAEGCSPKWEQECTISPPRKAVRIQRNTFLMPNACYSRYGATLETNGP